jgi:hypothetical protein
MSSIKTMKAWAVKIDHSEKIPAAFQNPWSRFSKKALIFHM